MYRFLLIILKILLININIKLFFQDNEDMEECVQLLAESVNRVFAAAVLVRLPFFCF